MTNIIAAVIEHLRNVNQSVDFSNLKDFFVPDDSYHPFALFGMSTCYYFENSLEAQEKIYNFCASGPDRDWSQSQIDRRLGRDRVSSRQDFNQRLRKILVEDAAQPGSKTIELTINRNKSHDYVLPNIERVAAVFLEKGLDSHVSYYIETETIIEQEQAASYVERFVEGCKSANTFFAQSGIAVIVSSGSIPGIETIYPILKRFPGLVYEDPAGMIIMFGSKVGVIRDTNWLTAINLEMADRIGGVERIEHALSPDVVVHKYETGLVFQAGAMPKLGDLNFGDVPSAYREVARLLQPLRFNDWSSGYIQVPDTVDAVAATIAWQERFD